MARRLQVLLDEAEHLEIRQTAERQGLSIAEWVRQSLKSAGRAETEKVSAKLRAVADAAAHNFPTGEIEEMLGDVEPVRSLS